MAQKTKTKKDKHDKKIVICTFINCPDPINEVGSMKGTFNCAACGTLLEIK